MKITEITPAYVLRYNLDPDQTASPLVESLCCVLEQDTFPLLITENENV